MPAPYVMLSPTHASLVAGRDVGCPTAGSARSDAVRNNSAVSVEISASVVSAIAVGAARPTAVRCRMRSSIHRFNHLQQEVEVDRLLQQRIGFELAHFAQTIRVADGGGDDHASGRV